MGFNTSVIVLNDALGQIEDDPNFGKNLAAAIRQRNAGNRSIDVPAGNHANAASVIETHHADYSVLLAVGGNFGQYLDSIFDHGRHNDTESQVRLLESWAAKLGYKIVPKRAK